MNNDINLLALKRRINILSPDDPQQVMMRVLLDAEIDTRFMEWRAELKEHGVRRIEINQRGRQVRFTPYLPGIPLGALMRKYWSVTNSHFPFALPPKFWGEHIL